MLRVRDAAWPVCEEHPADVAGESIGPRPMVSVAQFWAKDFPEIPFPSGTDLLQVYWCPNDHYIEYPNSDYGGPDAVLRWLDASTARGVEQIASGAGVRPVEESYLIRPCAIWPERVAEFPDCEELPPDVQERLAALDEREGLAYQYALSIAMGWKVGGWPSWHSTDKLDLECPDCGTEVDLLLKVDSCEWDGGSNRWQPQEVALLDEEDRANACRPTGAVVGRAGEMRIFTCRTDPRHRPVLDIQ